MASKVSVFSTVLKSLSQDFISIFLVLSLCWLHLMCPCGQFCIFGTRQGMFNKCIHTKMRNTRVGTAPCCSLGVQPGLLASFSPRPGRREGAAWRRCWNVFQPAGCQGCLWCRLWGTWPCYLAGRAVIYVVGWGRTGAVCSVLERGSQRVGGNVAERWKPLPSKSLGAPADKSLCP